MNYEAIKVWIDAAQFAWMIAATIWVFWGNKNKEVHDRVGAVESTVEKHGTQITRIESDAKHFPNHDDMGAVYRELRTVSGGMQLLTGEMKVLRGQVDLITKHMLDQH